MIIDPDFSLDCKSRFFARSPLCPIFTHKHQRLVKQIASYVVQHPCCTVVGILSDLPVSLGDWFALMIEYIAKNTEGQ